MQKLITIAYSAIILIACGFDSPKPSEHNSTKIVKDDDFRTFIKKFPIQEKMKTSRRP